MSSGKWNNLQITFVSSFGLKFRSISLSSKQLQFELELMLSAKQEVLEVHELYYSCNHLIVIIVNRTLAY